MCCEDLCVVAFLFAYISVTLVYNINSYCVEALVFLLHLLYRFPQKSNFENTDNYTKSIKKHR